MSDSVGFGAMLFGPEHALKLAAEAVAHNAESTDMAVGIIFGIRASIEEYTRLFTVPPSPVNTSAETTATEPTKQIAKADRAKDRVAGLSRA